MKEARAVPQQLCLEHPPARTSLEIFDSHPPSLLFLREPSVLLWMSPTPSSIPHPRCQVHLRCQAFLTQCMCMTWKKSGRLHCSSSSGRSIGIFLFLSLSLVLSLSLSLSLSFLPLPLSSLSVRLFLSRSIRLQDECARTHFRAPRHTHGPAFCGGKQDKIREVLQLPQAPEELWPGWKTRHPTWQAFGRRALFAKEVHSPIFPDSQFLRLVEQPSIKILEAGLFPARPMHTSPTFFRTGVAWLGCFRPNGL